MNYITYEEFIEFGGSEKIDKATFSDLLLMAESKLNRWTFGRIKSFVVVPQAVKKLLADYVEILFKADFSLNDRGLVSYSNGIESFGYSTESGGATGSRVLENRMYAMAKEYLCEYPYLLYRGI